MARFSIKVSIGTKLTDFNGVDTGLRGGAYGAAVTGGATDPAAVAADVAVLVADGATPTQAHVTTLNTDWGTLNGGLTGDLVVSFDATKITTITQLRRALDMALQAMQGAGNLTA